MIRAAIIFASNSKEKDVDGVIVALLHDIIEETEKSLDEINRKFGRWIGKDVDTLTKREGEKIEEYISRVLSGSERAIKV